MTRPPAPPAGLAHRPPPRPTLVVATKIYPPVPPMPEGVLIHPAADLMPMMTPEEFWDLVERIKKNGLREPISRLVGPHAGKWLGAIRDGRNRLLACIAGGVEPRYEDYEWDGEESLVGMVDDLGLGRRQLTPAQKVILLQTLKDAYAEEAAERMERGLLRAQAARVVVLEPGDAASPGLLPAHAGQRAEGGRTSAKLAKAGQVGEVTVKRVSRILRLAPELKDVLYNKTINVPQGLELAKFSAVDRATAIDRILAGEPAAAVIAELKPFAAADPKVLTGKERSAARVLQGLSQERQQLVLAEGKVAPAVAAKTTTTLLDRVLSDPKTTVDWRAVGVREARTERLLRPNMAALTLDEQVDSVVAVVVAARWGLLEPPSDALAAIREGVRAELTGAAQLTGGVLEGAQGRRAPKAASPEAARPQVLAELPWVLLWSHEKKMWWAANSMGYTNKLAEAGLYTLADATERAHGFSVVVPLTGTPPRPPKKGDKKTTHGEAARRAQAIRDEEGERPPRIRR